MAAITDLATCAAAGTGDWLVINDSGTDKKIDATLCPWTNTPSGFTRAVGVSPAVNEHALNVDMPTSATGRAYRWAYNGVERGYIRADAAASFMFLSAFDNGASVGPSIAVGKNNNASTPAAGYIQLTPKTASARRLWVDDTGLLRIHTADPTNANDTAGTVVGAQTSSLDAKDIAGDALGVGEILDHIAQGAAAVRRFTYKNGSFGGEEFSGIVVDYAPRYGMDRDAEHPHGKSLSIITAIGDLMIAVDYLARRVAALEAAHA